MGRVDWFSLLSIVQYPIHIEKVNNALMTPLALRVFMGGGGSHAPQQNLARLRIAFGDDATCNTTIYNWFAEFKRGRVNLSDEFRDGRSSTAVNNKNIDAVRRMIETDNYVTYRGVWASLGMGMNRIQSMLHKHLGMRKLCSRWIPHKLTKAQKMDRVT
ncbi:Histone-lysine N-methyltransferase SETMAR [Eumeta japonica]|uniref:Histone-lysine N-methyltransferase SETMAR n=1 Tax=Eumeta variegata TaxID=151549 RepID=A0A4C1VSW1_EUMVA|nr:Histone-lysine N-methyltransferase SETMAR [Eumeta japonica]